MNKIKVAIIGVGNCASSLIQGIHFYSNNADPKGIMYPIIGGYKISDIEFVCAFDVDKRKVGHDLSRAIFAEPNCTAIFSEVPYLGIEVKKGRVLDGVSESMRDIFYIDDDQKEVNIIQELVNAKADICVNYLPVGSSLATQFYAQACIDAGVAFANAIPEFICSNEKWSKKFKEAGIPCVGDDIKSQVGATIVHRILSRLIEDRGMTIDSTYQLNVGGNTDFLNMKEEFRLISKRISKTNAVLSILDSKDIGIRIGPSDYIPHLRDNKVCYINIKGKQFGGLPFDLDVKLSVEDSPNSAGVMTEVIRALMLAKDRGLTGNINDISAYTFKTPAQQVRDDNARMCFEKFIQ